MCGFAVWLTKFSSSVYRSLLRMNNVLVQMMVVQVVFFIRLLEIMPNKTVLIKITALLGKHMDGR